MLKDAAKIWLWRKIEISLKKLNFNPWFGFLDFVVGSLESRQEEIDCKVTTISAFLWDPP